MLLIPVCASWIGGLLIGSVHRLDGATALPLAFLCVVIAAALWRTGRPYLPALCLATVMLGGVRFGAAQEAIEGLDLKQYNGGPPVVLAGTVLSEPEVRGNWAMLTVGSLERVEGADRCPVSGSALVRTSWWEDWRSGDRVEVAGTLESPPVLDGFSYSDYLARRGIVSVVNSARIKLLARGQIGFPLGALNVLRDHLASVLSRALPEPQAGLAQGILIGLRANIAPAVLDAFSRTGTTHILAISGFNIAVVAGALSLVTRRILQRAPAALIAVLGIVLYTALVGAGPSVVRAAVMGVIVIAATYLGRQSHVLTSLTVVAALMTLLDPLILWDVAFQLSFLATGGLALVAPALSRLLAPLPAFLRDTLAVTVAAQAATLPVVVVDFRQISLVALPANLLVLPTLPVVMLTSGLTVLGGIVSPSLGSVVGWVAWPFLTCQIVIVELLSDLPWASLSVGEVPVALAWGYYAILGLVLLTVTHRSASAWQWLWSGPRWVWGGTIGASAIVAVVVWAGALTVPPQQMSVTFLNVGQGDATLIRTGSRCILVDGGPDPDVLGDALGRRLPFWDRQIDLAILTHGDADHLAGLLEVVRRGQVDQVLQTRCSADTELYSAWEQTLRSGGVPVVPAAGQEIDLGDGVKLSVLYPDNVLGPLGSGNDCSTVLRLACGEFSVLLAGDAGPDVQRGLLDSGVRVESTVLKVPHHGASGAVTAEFLEAVDPAVAVISVGRSNQFGHPAQSTLDQLARCKVYRTDVEGAILFEVHGGRCWVKTGSG